MKRRIEFIQGLESARRAVQAWRRLWSAAGLVLYVHAADRILGDLSILIRTEKRRARE